MILFKVLFGCLCTYLQGITRIRKLVQSNVDKRLVMWERYCLEHCFEVPEGFVLPKNVGPFLLIDVSG